MPLQIKRIYDPYQESDGLRYLVDRLWPRGISKEAAHLTGWLKTLAPSTALRKQFGHMSERFAEFSVLYRDELDASPDAQVAAREVIQQSRQHTVTIIYAAKDPHINHAVVLRDYLEEMSRMD
jgi:uncharacterized protein YeaO (DUF488 family)